MAHGSSVSSFATTLNVLEGLLAWERATDGGTPGSVAARRAGEEDLLERGLFRRRSTGDVADAEWLRFSFPTSWHYDVLRALNDARLAGVPPDDPRLQEAIARVRSTRREDGRWALEHTHPGRTHFPLEAGDGHPSRWTTLRALRVLR